MLPFYSTNMPPPLGGAVGATVRFAPLLERHADNREPSRITTPLATTSNTCAGCPRAGARASGSPARPNATSLTIRPSCPANASPRPLSSKPPSKPTADSPRRRSSCCPVTCVRRAPCSFLGGRTIRTAYIGLAEQRLSSRQFIGIVIRFVALYLLLKFFSCPDGVVVMSLYLPSRCAGRRPPHPRPCSLPRGACPPWKPPPAASATSIVRRQKSG